MTARGLVIKLMLAALVVLPVSAAAVFIAVFAKDTAEIASALAAVGAALFLASFFQVGLFFREVQLISERQGESRRHALTLARCMREMTARISTLEQARAEAETAVAEEADPAPAQPAPRPIAAAPAPPPRAGVRAAAPQPTPQPVPQPFPLAERRFLTLPQRRLAGIEIISTIIDDPEDRFIRGFRDMGHDGCMLERIDAAAGMIGRAGRAESAFVLVVAPAPLAQLPGSIEQILLLAGEGGEFTTRFLLGISQHSVRSGGAAQAQALARLARAGICFILTEVIDHALDPRALKACNITHVRMDAAGLVDAAMTPDSPATALCARLAAGGIALIAEGIDDQRLIPELIDLAVPLAEGPALTREPTRTQTVVALPQRTSLAPEPEAPPLRALAEDSVRYRAAG